METCCGFGTDRPDLHDYHYHYCSVILVSSRACAAASERERDLERVVGWMHFTFFVVGNKRQPPDSLFKGRQQSTGHLRLIAWRSTANTGVYLPLLTSSPNEHTFRGHRLPKNEKKTLSRSTADEGYQVSRRRDIAVPSLKRKCTIIILLLLSYSPQPQPATNHHIYYIIMRLWFWFVFGGCCSCRLSQRLSDTIL